MGFGSSDFNNGVAFGATDLGGAIGRAIGRRFKQTAPAYDEADGHAGIKAEALKELARYNPAHPLLNQAYRKRLFTKYASGTMEVPLIGEHPFAKDPDAK